MILSERFRADNQQDNGGFSTYVQTFPRLITSLTPSFACNSEAQSPTEAKRSRTDAQTEKFGLKRYEEPPLLLSSPRLADVTCETTFRENKMLCCLPVRPSVDA